MQHLKRGLMQGLVDERASLVAELAARGISAANLPACRDFKSEWFEDREETQGGKGKVRDACVGEVLAFNNEHARWIDQARELLGADDRRKRREAQRKKLDEEEAADKAATAASTPAAPPAP